MRLDVYLTENGYAESRQKAKFLLSNGAVYVNGKLCEKASLNIVDHTVEVRGDGLRYVSRGGLKLEGALLDFQVPLPQTIQGKIAIDIGASTGGFTDCLLQNGVAKVYAVDSGSSQLHPKLQNDARVISLENLNARLLSRAIVPDSCEIATMDLSFISQTLIYPVLGDILAPDALLFTLIKPQFEAGRQDVGKNGIVKDLSVHLRILRTVLSTAAASGFCCEKLARSRICGGDGNQEYVAQLRYYKESRADLSLPSDADFRATVFGGHVTGV